MTEIQESNPLPPDQQAAFRLSLGEQEYCAKWFQVIARRVDPSHPQFSPTIPIEQLARDAGEDPASVCRKLRQWNRGLYHKSGRLIAPPKCLAALARRRPGPAETGPKVTQEQAQELIDEATSQLRSSRGDRIRYKRVWAGFQAREVLTGEKAPSLSQARRILHRFSPQELLAASGGVEALKKDGGLPRLTIPPPALPNEVWLGDQWVMDVFVQFDDGSLGRPVAYTFMDRFGGGFIVEVGVHERLTGHTVVETFVDAVSRHGRPLVVKLDLGKEGRLTAFLSGCFAIGTKIERCTPRDPATKGALERAHGEFRAFCSELPRYAPSDVKTKPIDDRPPLKLAELIERFRAFVFGTFNMRPYTGLHGEAGKSRLDLRNSAKFTPVIPSEEDLRVLFAEAKLVTVWSQGIKRHGLFFSHPQLAQYIGQKVWARQGRGDTNVMVHDENMEFLCVAQNALSEAARLDDETRRQFTADRRELARALETQAHERIRRARSRPDWLRQLAMQRVAETDIEPPRKAVRQLTSISGQTPPAAGAQPSGRRLKLSRFQR